MEAEAANGLWPLVVVNIALFIVFAASLSSEELGTGGRRGSTRRSCWLGSPLPTVSMSCAALIRPIPHRVY
jgi:hypothetical protein